MMTINFDTITNNYEVIYVIKTVMKYHLKKIDTSFHQPLPNMVQRLFADVINDAIWFMNIHEQNHPWFLAMVYFAKDWHKIGNFFTRTTICNFVNPDVCSSTTYTQATSMSVAVDACTCTKYMSRCPLETSCGTCNSYGLNDHTKQDNKSYGSTATMEICVIHRVSFYTLQWVSDNTDCCLTPHEHFSTVSWGEQGTFDGMMMMSALY